MHFRQFYLGCLAHASYFIGSNGEAAVVDPQRDVDQYLDEAERLGMRIRWIIETHLHADFVSGHRELAERTGAQIVFGAAAGAELAHVAVHDGDELRAGEVTLRAIETPGHTPESVSWLVTAPGETPRVLTGDTLFIGDVGRPDLAGSRGFTSEQMAGMLYDSLHEKLLALGDEVEVWPAHGAGSACGRNISSDRSSTIGAQRRMNYALQPMPREKFVELMTTDLAAPPRYFPIDAEINRRGARALAEVTPPRLTPREVEESGAMLLDVRDAASFGAGHIEGSINIGLRGQYASWAGTLLPHDARLIVIADGEKQIAEAVMRLARVGFENVAGTFDIREWPHQLVALPQIDVSELRAKHDDLAVLDVRRPGEYESGHVPGARNVPLPELEERVTELDAAKRIAVICASGYRSSTAASILQRHSFAALYNVVGGTSAWVAAGFDTE